MIQKLVGIYSKYALSISGGRLVTVVAVLRDECSCECTCSCRHGHLSIWTSNWGCIGVYVIQIEVIYIYVCVMLRLG